MTVANIEPSNALVPASLEERITYANTLAASGLLPRAYRDNPANCLIAIELGDAMGLRPIVAMQAVHVIEGTPSQSSNLMAATVRRAGHILRIQVDDKHLVVKATLIRKDDPDFAFEARWDMEKAKTAGLLGKDNWKKNPISMLRARAISEVCRSGASECLLGVEYTPDEVESFSVPASSPLTVTQVAGVRDWRVEVDAVRGDYGRLKALHSEAYRAGAFRLDPTLQSYFEAAKAKPEPTPERVDEQTGEILDAELVEPEPVFEPDAPEPQAPSVPAAAPIRAVTAKAIAAQFERCGIEASTVDAWLPTLGIPRTLAELSQDEAVELLDTMKTLDRDKLAAIRDEFQGQQ